MAEQDVLNAIAALSAKVDQALSTLVPTLGAPAAVSYAAHCVTKTDGLIWFDGANVSIGPGGSSTAMPYATIGVLMARADDIYNNSACIVLHKNDDGLGAWDGNATLRKWDWGTFQSGAPLAESAAFDLFSGTTADNVAAVYDSGSGVVYVLSGETDGTRKILKFNAALVKQAAEYSLSNVNNDPMAMMVNPSGTAIYLIYKDSATSKKYVVRIQTSDMTETHRFEVPDVYYKNCNTLAYFQGMVVAQFDWIQAKAYVLSPDTLSLEHTISFPLGCSEAGNCTPAILPDKLIYSFYTTIRSFVSVDASFNIDGAWRHSPSDGSGNNWPLYVPDVEELASPGFGNYNHTLYLTGLDGGVSTFTLPHAVVSDRTKLPTSYDAAKTAASAASVGALPSAATILTAVEGSTVLAKKTDVQAVTGSGNTAVDEDTGGTDNLRYVDGSGNGIDNGEIRCYLKTDYDSGRRSAGYLKGRSKTNTEGRWSWPVYLDSGFTYTIVFFKQGIFSVTTAEVTI